MEASPPESHGVQRLKRVIRVKKKLLSSVVSLDELKKSLHLNPTLNYIRRRKWPDSRTAHHLQSECLTLSVLQCLVLVEDLNNLT